MTAFAKFVENPFIAGFLTMKQSNAQTHVCRECKNNVHCWQKLGSNFCFNQFSKESLLQLRGKKARKYNFAQRTLKCVMLRTTSLDHTIFGMKNVL